MQTNPRFDLERIQENALGLRTTGGVLLSFAGLLWVFVFISIRNGTMLFPAWATIQTFVGFALVGIGLRKEKALAAVHAEMAPRELRAE